jgi:hypothetical protein
MNPLDIIILARPNQVDNMYIFSNIQELVLFANKIKDKVVTEATNTSLKSRQHRDLAYDTTYP